MILLKLLLALFFFVEFVFLIFIDFLRKKLTDATNDFFYLTLLLLIIAFLLVDYYLINEVATYQYALILDKFYSFMVDLSYLDFYIQFKIVIVYFIYVVFENYDLFLEELNNSSDDKSSNQDPELVKGLENQNNSDKKTETNNKVDNNKKVSNNKKDLQDPASKGFESENNSNNFDDFDDLFDF